MCTLIRAYIRRCTAWLEHYYTSDMAGFPYLPMVAIMMTLGTDMILQMSVVSYSGFMVKHLGVVDDKNKSGEGHGHQARLCLFVCGFLVVIC